MKFNLKTNFAENLPFMEELFEYHKAKNLYFNSLSSSKLPLISWDFYGNFLQEISQNLEDLKRLQGLKTIHNWISDFDFQKELQEEKVIVVTDPTLKIIFASRNVIKMTGYEREEVIGKTPKFFQGEATSKIVNTEIRKSIETQQSFDEIIVNYRKSGETYECHIKGFPVFNKKGELSHFIAFEKAA